MRKPLFLLLLIALCCGCGHRELERPSVPIVWGMRLNEPADEVELSPNLAKLRELVMRNVLIELPLRADSAGLPVVATALPAPTVGLLLRYKVGLNLAFCTTNARELFPTDSIPETSAWFVSLEKGIVAVLKEVRTYPIKRVIIAGEWGKLQGQAAEWKTMLEQLRNQFPKVPFSMGGRTEVLDSSGLAALSDEIVIDYPPIAGEELKAPCREENVKIADLAGRLGKPVFIYRANVIGEEPLLQIKNRLRFWPAETQLNGICMNTLYAKVPPRDAKTYYGLADDPEVLSYLKTYVLGEAN